MTSLWSDQQYGRSPRHGGSGSATRVHQNTLSAPKWCTSESRDIDEQSNRLTDWTQEYNQYSSGPFRGCVKECFFDQIQLINEYTSQGLHQQCQVWPDAFWIGITSRREPFRINGLSVGKEDLLWRHGGTSFELVTPADCNILSIVIPKERLFRLAERQGVRISPGGADDNPRLCADPAQIRALGQLVERILDAGGKPFDPEVHQDLLLQQLLNLLQGATPNEQVTPSYRHRKAVVDRVREYVDSSGDQGITMTALCELTNVSRRTLQYSFESILGISPSQFLRATRLNRVRRTLLSTRGISIADAAASQGFYHQSQFTADYKHLFGERPSETLKRVCH